MNTKMNGQAIQCIYFDGGVGNWSGNPERITATPELHLNLSATFHGDHDEFWVVESDANYREIRRHNCRNVSTIEWQQSNPGSSNG